MVKCRVFYLGSEVKSEAIAICEGNDSIFIGPSRPLMDDEDGEQIVGLYVNEVDTMKGAWNLDGCELIEKIPDTLTPGR